MQREKPKTFLFYGILISFLASINISYADTPTNVQFASVSSTAVNISWTLGDPGVHAPLVVFSTMSDFSVNLTSTTGSVGLQTTSYAVADNTTFYFKVKVSTEPDANYSAAISTLNDSAVPTRLVFDEIFATSITVSAYAPGPAFSNLNAVLSGVDISVDAAFAGYRNGGNTWTSKANMSLRRTQFATTVWGGKIYAIGGLSVTSPATTGVEMEVYDPVTNLWAPMASMPTARNSMAAAAVNGKIYVIGGVASVGGAYLGTNEEYDTEANTWVSKTAMPTARYSLAVVALDGKIYAIGGSNGSPLNTNEMYDPATDSWVAKADMTTARMELTAAVVDARIYALGGYNGSSALATNERYDPGTNLWTGWKSAPTARRRLASASVGGKIYVVGGNLGGSTLFGGNEEYDPAADAWTIRAAMPASTQFLSAAAAGGRVYAIGGSVAGSDVNSTIAYDPGMAVKFGGLAPNTSHTFQAKARNLVGTETALSASVSTYTLAAVAPPTGVSTFTNVTANSFTVRWSSGTSLTGYNPIGTQYLVEISTKASFYPVADSSLTANSSADFAGLNTGANTYFARVTAFNAVNAANRLALGSLAVTPGAPPLGVSTFTAVTSFGMTVQWSSGTAASGYNPSGTIYELQIATVSDFSSIGVTSRTANLSATLSIADNTTQYARVAVFSAGYIVTPFTPLGYTFSPIATPTSIAFDEISATTITASAYAPSPGFSNLDRGLSGVNVSIINGTGYAGYRNGNQWVSRTAMTTGRYWLGVVAYGGYVYAIGGTTNGSNRVDTVETYDPVTDSWYTKAVMPTTRFGLAVAVAGGKIYAIGGNNGVAGSTTNEAYDPETNSWSSKATMPTLRQHLAAASINGKIYAIGGDQGGPDLGTNEVYNPDTNAWISGLTSLSIARAKLTAVSFDGKIYAIGGGQYSGAIEAYDPGGNSWSSKATMPMASQQLAAAAVGSKIYAVGGFNGSALSLNREYDVANDTWTARALLSSADYGFAAAALNGRIYVIGGQNNPTGNFRYDPGTASQFTGLSPNTLYNFKAKARDAFGNETFESPVVSTYTLALMPTAPVNLSTFTNVDAASLRVNWSSGSTATGYNPITVTYLVQLATTSTFTSFVSSQTANSYAVFNAVTPDSKPYFARVAGVNSVNMRTGWFDLGSLSSATIQMGLPAIAATAGDSYGIAWADYNNDGSMGFAVAHGGSGVDSVVMRNNGDGTFTQIALTGSGTGGDARGLAWGDADKDGYMDVAIANAGGNDSILMHNNKDGTFTKITLTGSGTGGDARGIAWGDYNNDGNLDIALANANVDAIIMQNNGGGSFAKITPNPLNGSGAAQTLAWGDYNNDGYLDVALSSGTGDATLMRNNGNGSFTQMTGPNPLSGSGAGISIAWGDFNNDGHLDLAVANPAGDSVVMQNNGNGTFTSGVLTGSSPGGNARGVAWGDSNNDGYSDLAVANSNNAPEAILRNNGVGTFTKTDIAFSSVNYVALLSSGNSRGIAFGDFDGNGAPDLAVANNSGQNEIILRNDFSSVHTPPTAPNSGFSASFQEYGVFSSSGVLTLSWSDGSDSKMAAAALKYGVRVGTSSGNGEILRLPRKYSIDGYSGGGSFLYSTKITGIQRGLRIVMQKETTAYWAITAENAEFNRSPESSEQTTKLSAPSAASNLGASQNASIQTSSVAWIYLNWTSPGENGDVGALQSGATYDIRWATFPITNQQTYLAAPFQLIMPADGPASSPVSTMTAVTPGKTYYFALTTKNSIGVRSALSNSPAATPPTLQYTVASLSPVAMLEGQTTAFLMLNMWTESGSLQWRNLTVSKIGTVPDASIERIGIYRDANTNGTFDGAGTDFQTSVNAVFSSSQATISLLGGSGEQITTSTKTYFVGVALQSNYLPVDGSTISIALNGWVFTVSSGGVLSPNVTTSGEATAYQTGTVLWSTATSIAAMALARSAVNAPILKLDLWTPADFVTINQLVVERTGTVGDAGVAAARIFLDNGDGAFGSGTDTALTADQVFSAGIATFNFIISGNQQLIGTSTRTYWLTLDISPGAIIGSTLGLRISATTQFLISGTTNTMSSAGFPIVSSAAPIVAAFANVSASASTGTWTNVSTISFTGTFIQDNVDHYRYVWDQNSTTDITGTEPIWNSGALVLSPSADATNWYLHVRGYDGTSSSGTQQNLGPFWIDRVAPTAGAFQALSSSGGILAETQWNHFGLGTTAQITIQDVFAGLAISSGSFGVIYSTNAGQSWIDGTWNSMGSPISGETQINTFATYDGKLYAGTSSNGKAAVFDGNSWAASNGGNPLIVGQTGIYSLAVYNGKLYAGTSPNGKIAVFDGNTWTPSNSNNPIIAGETTIKALAVHNGKLYAGTAPNGKVAVFDGASWSATNGNSAIIVGETSVNSLAAYNGKLYAGTSPNGKVAVFDGANWSTSNGGSSIIAGETSIQSLAVYNGSLYAGTSPNGKVAVFNSVIWTATNGNNSIVSGANAVNAMTAFNGRLYAGTSPNARIVAFSTTWMPVNGSAPIIAGSTETLSVASFNGELFAGAGSNAGVARLVPLTQNLTGTSGSTAVQTLSGSSLSLVRSTNSVTCGGIAPCGASNQVRLTASDLAGNVRIAGPFAVLADSMTPIAASTPSYPANGGFVNVQPNFNWAGPSTSVIAGIGSGASYLLQASINDPAFAPGNILISISSPALIASAVLSQADGQYISTYTLQNNTTYYWHVAARDRLLGSPGPWSQTYSFITDFSSPSATGFVSVSSTGGYVAQSQWQNLAIGVTAQMTVQDTSTGLILSTGAGGGYGVIYSTNAGQSWFDGAWNAMGNLISGETQVNALAVYNGKLYAGTFSNGKVAEFDGNSWTASNGGNALISGENAINTLAVYQGKLYAGTSPNGKMAIFDGASWTAANGDTPINGTETSVNALMVYNGKLYAGTSPNGKVIVSDGNTWTATNNNSAVVSGESSVLSLAVYNGKLYAGTSSNGKVAVFDGAGWSVTNAGASVLAGETAIKALAVYNGNLYAGTSPNGKAAVFNGVSWAASNGNNPLITGETSVNTLAAFNGRLYAGTSPGAKVALLDGIGWGAGNGNAALASGETQVLALAGFGSSLYAGTGANATAVRLIAVNAALTGSDGSVSAQTLSVYELNLVKSTNAVSCTGSSPCGATNQVKFAVADRAGNIKTSGAAIWVDTTTYYATAVPTAPANGSFIRTQPNFSWIGASTSVVAGMGAGASYWLQVSSGDASFVSTQVVVSVAIPAVVTSTAAATADATYVSTYTLVQGTTYYWRVQARSALGAVSPASAVSTFVLDLVGPTLSNYVSFNSAGTSLNEIQWTNMASGATVQMNVQDTVSGLASLAGDFQVQYSTDAGVSWQTVTSLTQGALPYLVFNGVQGSTAVYALQGANFGLLQSTSTLTCGGISPCGATNQVRFIATDRAGNGGSAGPFAVVVDSTPPTVALMSVTPSSTTLAIAASGADDFSGLRDFNFETSSSPVFAFGVSSSNFIASTTHTITGLVEGTTYYVRVFSRDNALNVSPPSASSTTSTIGTVIFSSANAASANVLQGTEAAMLYFTLQTPPGTSGLFNSIVVRQSGTAVDGDLVSAKIYLDAAGAGAFDPNQDIQLAATPMSGGAAALNLGGNAQTIDVSPKGFFIVYNVSDLANIGGTLGARILSSSDIGLGVPFSATGPFPTNSNLSTIQDGINVLNFSAVNQAPSNAPPGSTNIPMLKFLTQTSSGTSVLQSMILRLNGNLPSNQISSVRIFRDANANGVLDGADAMLTSGSDIFTSGVSTLNFTAVLSSRTITPAQAIFFVAVNLSGSASVSGTFGVQLSTASDVTLGDPLDTVLFSVSPLTSTLATIQVNNTITATISDTGVSTLAQGLSYAVLKISATVDSGIAQINRFSINRVGVGNDSDVSSVQIYQHPVNDGLPWNSLVDVALGSAAFSGGSAAVSITTTTLTAGATSVFFVIYNINPTATIGDTLGAGMTNNSYIGAVSPFTQVTGNFPFSGSAGTVIAGVNRLQVAALDQTPGTLVQGTTNVALLRLTVNSDFNPIIWSGLRLDRTGTGTDADVQAIKIYRDFNSNGVWDNADTLATSGADTFFNGFVNVNFNPAPLIGTSTQTYFVTADIEPLATPGGSIGVQITTTTSFNLNNPNLVSTSSLSFPVIAGPVPIQQFANTVTISTEAIAPAGANIGASDVGIIKMTLRTNRSYAQWLQLRIDRGGTSTDQDIQAVKIYYDVNGQGNFDSTNINSYMLVSSTGVSFGSSIPGSVTLTIASATTLSPSNRTYYVAVDISTSATSGRTVVAQVLNASYVTVNAPNTVAATGFASTAMTINDPPSVLFLTGTSSAPVNVTQGSVNVPILTLKARMQGYTGRWSGLTVSRTGTGSDFDISRVNFYADTNNNGLFQPLVDTLLTTATFSNGSAQLIFSTQTITTSTMTFFVSYDVSAVAVATRTIGASIGSAGAVTLAPPHGVSIIPSGGIVSSNTLILATQNGVSIIFQNKAPPSLPQGSTNQVMLSLTMNTTAQAVVWNSISLTRTGTASDSDIAAIHVFKDSNDNAALDASDAEITTGNDRFISGSANVFLSQSQTITVTPVRYFVALDMDLFAIPTNTVGLTINSAASFGVTSPNYIVNTGFPLVTSVVSITKLADTLLSAWTDLTPVGVNQGAEVSMAKVTASAQRDFVDWSALFVGKQGTLADSFVNQVRIYRDANGDGTFDGMDVLVGTGTVTAGQANVPFWTTQRLSTASRTYFVNFVFTSNATIGGTVGASIPNASFFTLVAPDVTSSAGLPFSGALANVLDAQTPTIPIVTPRNSYWKLFDSLEFLWSSTVGSGTIAGAQYAIGTTPGGAETLGFTALTPLATDFVATSLVLQNGATYYVSVRTQSSYGFTSPAGISGPILVDYTVPSAPMLTYVQGSNSVLISWTTSQGGASGVAGYVVQYHSGTSPVWLNAKTGSAFIPSAVHGAGLESGRGAGFSPLAISSAEMVTGGSFSFNPPDGTIYIQVQAVSGSGVLGAASDPPIRLIFGALPQDGISLVSNYPNPFDSRKGRTTINYTLTANSDITIKIFNIFGGRVKEMSFSSGGAGGMAGANEVTWDGADDSGRKVSKGMYIAVISGGGAKVRHKIGVIH